MTASTLPATEKQVAFIGRLSAERGVGRTLEPLTKAQASHIIELLLATPVHRPSPVAAAPLEPGMYRDAAGMIFKVQASKESGNLYAKKLTQIGGERLTESDAVVRWELSYAPGAIKALTAAQRMSLEEAKAFGIRYGVCCVCGAFLRDATSVAAGIGPVCATKV